MIGVNFPEKLDVAMDNLVLVCAPLGVEPEVKDTANVLTFDSDIGLCFFHN